MEEEDMRHEHLESQVSSLEPGVPKDIGGQAVIEGVMMRAPASIVIAVRRPDHEIVVKREKLTPLKERFLPFKWPILRGIAVLAESLVWGMKALTYSANQAVETNDLGSADLVPASTGVSDRRAQKLGEYPDTRDTVIGDSTLRKTGDDPPKEMGGFTIAVTVLISIALGIGLFVIIPAWLAGLVSERGFVFNIADGAIRLAVFLTYVLVISRSRYIARVFEYHGAEHKSIHTYEAGEELTEDNALKYSPLHPRCGTAFLLTVMVISILVFSIFGKPESIFVRIGTRLALIPFIAGISYEIIKLASKKQHSKFMRLITLPGLWLQRLTTREPSRDQIQVAIRSLAEVLAMEAEQE